MSNMSNGLLLEALTLMLCISALVVTTHSLGNLDLELPYVQRCLSPILGVPGCLNELIDSDLRLEPQLLGPPCCKAFLKINQYCWAKMFPMNLGFAPSLKDYCLGLPPPSPPPNTPGPPPFPFSQTPPPSIPQTPPPQSPHNPSPRVSPRKPPTSSPNTQPRQSPHKPPLPSSPSKTPSHSPTPASSDTPPAASPDTPPAASPQKPPPSAGPQTPPQTSQEKPPPLICTSDVDMDDLSEEWDGDGDIN